MRGGGVELPGGDQGRWRLVMKRPLATGERNDGQFASGAFIPPAVGAWNGSDIGPSDGRGRRTFFWQWNGGTVSMKILGIPWEIPIWRRVEA